MSQVVLYTAMRYHLAYVGFYTFSIIKDRQLPYAPEPVGHACVKPLWNRLS